MLEIEYTIITNNKLKVTVQSVFEAQLILSKFCKKNKISRSFVTCLLRQSGRWNIFHQTTLDKIGKLAILKFLLTDEWDENVTFNEVQSLLDSK